MKRSKLDGVFITHAGWRERPRAIFYDGTNLEKIKEFICYSDIITTENNTLFIDPRCNYPIKVNVGSWIVETSAGDGCFASYSQEDFNSEIIIIDIDDEE